MQARETKPSQGNPAAPSASLFRLDGRSIIITGGIGFLGLTVAESVLENGGDVYCLDYLERPRPETWEPLEATAKKYSGVVKYHKCDVTDADSVTQTISAIASTARHPIRGLVACAGVSDKDPATEFSVDRFRRLMDINVTGTFLSAQAVAREMRKANVSGSMVLVASMSGTNVNKGVDTAAYNTSKSGVLQLARSLASEWGSRAGMPLIRVNTLSPGYIRTAATEDTLKIPGIEELWSGDNMLNRLSTVDEFRAPVLFLLGDGSSFMTASDLRVDGGHCAW
ncbi:hypothetical protein ASPSYDRAFT_162362 [Aspergillus sydowii CBS 593.65]|uniref:Uncharacterized protein n=1 Tax=Aspergillus sydowii CBS 593.65 TaxID=1036612 RepID=A0A1L9T1W3_9EURO|nr:uncharacterized protein ASPSYDRAFT_162362 [Aspergillus sydowii CBS 593.65]OJJ53440.1 hypothetical protein ASPSYDRAFT_162362 [Aspergillus sydowii CBS 593.65]